MLNHPTSSPMMTSMLGGLCCFGCCAAAGAAAANTTEDSASKPTHAFLIMLICFLPPLWLPEMGRQKSHQGIHDASSPHVSRATRLQIALARCQQGAPPDCVARAGSWPTPPQQ